ncbi:hypothetical protein BGZ95_004939, partial [Linnemannia exigua]
LWAIRNAQDFAQDIARLCPKLSSMYDLEHCGPTTPGLIDRLLGTLPQQQAKKIYCTNKDVLGGQDLGDALRMFRRHSTTLQSVTIYDCKNIDSKMIQVILVECVALEELAVNRNPSNTSKRRGIDLEDAVEFPWASTKIRTLGLTVDVPDEPLHYLAENTVPYYNRPGLMELSAAEKKQFKSFEALYRQIGALTELRKLILQANFFDPEGHRASSGDYHPNVFPGMLSLGCEETGRPGYLDHFAGLTKLKLLWGSVSATTKETKVTVGMDEVRWPVK